MKKNQQDLEKDKFYHIYNRGNNSCLLFYNEKNYEFFLRRFDMYLSDFVDVYAYCLLPNHFHLLIRIKEVELVDEHGEIETISKAFHRLFTSYSKAINKQENRHGSLFENPFKRKEITDETYFTNLVFYIHANPQLHELTTDFKTYYWSSFARILNDKPSKLKKEEVLDWFNDKENYVFFHNQKMEFAELFSLLLEDK